MGNGTLARASRCRDQPGAIQQFDPPILFQIALLHRRDWPVYQYQPDLFGLEQRLQLGDLALAKQFSGMRLWQTHDRATPRVQPR